MTNMIPDESRFYNIRMRGTCPDLKKVKLYTDTNRFDAHTVMSFDNEFDGFSSMSYFLGSLLSSIILTSIKELKTNSIELDEIEGVIEAKLLNPLRMIPVRGAKEPSELSEIMVKIYYYSDVNEEEVTKIIKECQAYNPLYRLINQSVPIALDIELVL